MKIIIEEGGKLRKVETGLAEERRDAENLGEETVGYVNYCRAVFKARCGQLEDKDTEYGME